MRRLPPRSTRVRSSAASDVYKRQTPAWRCDSLRGLPRIPAFVTPSSPSPLVHRRETWALSWDRCFRDESFQNGRVSRQPLGAKSLDVKLDRRFDVSQGFVVCVTVTHYHAFETKRVRHVAIWVRLDDNLELPLHGLIRKSSTDAVRNRGHAANRGLGTPGTDETDMSFRRSLPETRCQPCLSPVTTTVRLPAVWYASWMAFAAVIVDFPHCRLQFKIPRLLAVCSTRACKASTGSASRVLTHSAASTSSLPGAGAPPGCRRPPV